MGSCFKLFWKIHIFSFLAVRFCLLGATWHLILRASEIFCLAYPLSLWFPTALKSNWWSIWWTKIVFALEDQNRYLRFDWSPFLSLPIFTRSTSIISIFPIHYIHNFHFPSSLILVLAKVRFLLFSISIGQYWYHCLSRMIHFLFLRPYLLFSLKF